MAQRIRFRIDISKDAYLRYYQGNAKYILVRAEDGRRVQLPAHNFRQFIQPDGLRGRFEVELDSNNKLIKLSKIA